MRLLITSLAVLVVTGACSSGSEPAADTASERGGAASTASITAVDNAFEPDELQLTAGEEVTVSFTNEGDAIHTFTSDELGLDTGSVEPGATADVTFTAPTEETAFVCSIHEQSDNMVGAIVPSK